MPGGTGSCPLAAARGRGRREPLAAARPRGWPGPGSRQRRAPLRCPVLRAPGCPRCPVLCPPVSSRSPVLRPPGSPARSRRRRSGSRGGTAGEERARGGWKVPVARRGRSYPGLGGVSRFPDSPGGVIPVWMEYPGFPDSPGGVIPVWLEYPGFHEHREELSRFGWIIPVSIGTGRSYPGLLELPDDFRVYGWELSRNFPGSPGGVIPVWVEYPGFHGHREELSRFGWNIPVSMGTGRSYPGLGGISRFPWTPGGVIPLWLEHPGFQTHREELSRFGWSIPVSMGTGRSYPGLGGVSRFSRLTGRSFPGLAGASRTFPRSRSGWSIPVSRLTRRNYPGLTGASQSFPRSRFIPDVPRSNLWILRERPPPHHPRSWNPWNPAIPGPSPIQPCLSPPSPAPSARLDDPGWQIPNPGSQIPNPADPCQLPRPFSRREGKRIPRECRAWMDGAAFLALNPDPAPPPVPLLPHPKFPAGNSRLQLRIPWNSVAIRGGGIRRGHGGGGWGWEPLRCCRGKDSLDSLFQRDPCWECAAGNREFAAGNSLPPFPASLRGVVALGDIPKGKNLGKEGRAGKKKKKREVGGSFPLPKSQVGIFLGFFFPPLLPPLWKNPWNFLGVGVIFWEGGDPKWSHFPQQ
ncbi:uncharacterized protein LOC125317919 isoform X4 [Corvus hawaiiensis]|uniref:uncharacterized protein LOC125317919 isoform X4 n=1 Tax=Corvus hawaiiensis TaxID=134902 RepID=UPI00201994CF|nr:uncharacterized protein LOC125317919 isoform X4 [Corvus hawaiiensis]